MLLSSAVVFLTQSELIEPVLPQAAQLGIHFFKTFYIIFIEMHLLEGQSVIYYEGKTYQQHRRTED